MKDVKNIYSMILTDSFSFEVERQYDPKIIDPMGGRLSLSNFEIVISQTPTKRNIKQTGSLFFNVLEYQFLIYYTVTNEKRQKFTPMD